MENEKNIERINNLEKEVNQLTDIFLLFSANCIKEVVEMQVLIEYALKLENHGKITVETASILLNSERKGVRRLYSMRQLGLVKWKKGVYTVLIRKTGMNLLREIMARRYLLVENKIQRRFSLSFL